MADDTEMQASGDSGESGRASWTVLNETCVLAKFDHLRIPGLIDFGVAMEAG